MEQNKIQIYQTADGETRVNVRFERESVWLIQRQMGDVFDSTPENILMHLKNIFRDGELDESATAKDFLVVQTEGKRRVERNLKHYNLDAIISVGYRVSSKRAVQFRQWATQRLKEYLVQGYTLNQARFDRNAAELQQALALIRKAAQSPGLSAESGSGLVEIVSRYTQTFLWLQRYDEGMLAEPAGQSGGRLPDADEAMAALRALKKSLIERGEATGLFAQPRGDGLAALLGNLDQSVFGEPAYPTIESKAAHLLYFVVKNHPFADGNKRSGAFLFVDFLHRNGRLLNARGEAVINDTGLAALTLLVAESDPKQKETLIRLRGYDCSQAGMYFVTICAQGRLCLFGDVVDGAMQLNDAGRLAHEKWRNTEVMRENIILHEFIVMPNHVHGIIEIAVGARCTRPLSPRADDGQGRVQRAPTVGDVVRGYKSAVTKRVSQLHERPGLVVWQRNYYEHIIRDEDSYLKIAEYIQTNPQRWQMDTYHV